MVLGLDAYGAEIHSMDKNIAQQLKHPEKLVVPAFALIFSVVKVCMIIL